MTTGWSIFVIVITLANVAGAAWLMRWSSRMSTGGGATTGHVWDGDIVEGNNPLPRWWLGLFWITIVWGLLFFIAYPSFGDFSLLGWSQIQQYDDEIAAAEAEYGQVFAAFAATPLEELRNDPDALSAGRNLFVNNCAPCHGSDARGARGYPNLTDAEWQWGGTPAQIETTIRMGRTGVMPPWGATLDENTRELLADYVLSLAGREVDPARAEQGQMHFRTYCVACHGFEGEGNPLLGAPPLANEIWTHGAGRSVILDVIANGRTNMMPAQEPLLGADRVHVLAAYVLSLSTQNQ
jgi:cytochrome c oxidase cbb3-type subunit 3